MNRLKFNLNVIEVKSPCPVPWETMKDGDGASATRFCEHCNRHVHDLTSMTRADAVDLICKNAGELCVRFTRDEDGVVKTLDYAPAKRGSGLRKWLCLSAILGIAGGVANYMWHRTGVVPAVIAPAPQPMIVGALPAIPCPPTAQNTNKAPNSKPAQKQKEHKRT